MDKPISCPRCYRNTLVETETRRYIDEQCQLKSWDNEGGHDAGQRQDSQMTMREVAWTCTSCGWKKVAYSTQEPVLGPERRIEKFSQSTQRLQTTAAQTTHSSGNHS